MPTNSARVCDFAEPMADAGGCCCSFRVGPMILFLGAGGDLGSVAVEELRRYGHEVMAPTSKELNLTNSVAVQSFCRNLPRSYAVVFAAFVDRRRGETAAEYDVNMRITENVLSYTRPDWMVFTSSIVVYGERPATPITESTMLIDSGLYARAKREAEQMVMTASQGKYPTFIARLPGVFGGRSNRNQSLDRILLNGMRSQQVVLGANGFVRRDWLSAWEVTEFLHHFATNPLSGLANVVRGDSLTIDDYVSKALEVVRGVRHDRLEALSQEDLAHFVFDASHFRSLFPSWEFPNRQRDLHRLARELSHYYEQTAHL